MEKLEGEEARPPAQPLLAYMATGSDEVGRPVEGVTRREDTADGDVLEASFAKEDILNLQRLLQEREREAEEAKRQAQELQSELAAVKAESGGPREVALPPEGLKPLGTPPEDPDATTRLVGDAFAELARVRTESYKARVEMEKERSDHRSEMVKARAQYHAAQDELQRVIKVRRTAPPPVPAPKPPPRQPEPVVLAPPEGQLKKIAGGLAVATLGVVSFLLWPRVSRWSQERAVPVNTAPPPALMVREQSPIPLTPAARAQFQNAVSRLSRVLASRPGRAPEELLHEVHEKYKDSDPHLCSFSWRNGQPSLVYSGGHLSLGQTIQRCADAIEKVR